MMISCTPEQCAVCQLIPGTEFCLRKQARKYLALSRRVFSKNLRETLSEFGGHLMREAERVRDNEGASGRSGPPR